MSTGILSRGLKRPGRQCDHSLLSSAEVNTVWRYNSPRSIRMPSCLVHDGFALGFTEILVLGVIATNIFAVLSYFLVPKPRNMYRYKMQLYLNN